ncbi:DUF4249 domain-containing protein [Pontibacter silvestris]|uniref:DUF4249 domain-containing protein n=1 Tax=Pontibacter silvestris TaxID=2305183 RepID=A0ABW4X097_9BACT|nr:DUF4249 domain-containing protein [Pontibacter silvestris]MCC9135461.1 DUF4249 domain-containing protein [Pontibacter silvestris]
MKLKSYLYIILLLLFTACDRDKEIYIDLPAHTPQLVVECYLEPGQPFRLTVLESASYFASPDPPLVPDAKVFIMFKDQRVELTYKPGVNKLNNKFYTHTSSVLMTGEPGDIYTLEVTDNQGRKVTGTTTILPVVPIDTVEWRFSDDNEKAILITSFQDVASTANYYRYMANPYNLDTSPEQDEIHDDNLNNGKRISLNSSYEFNRNDTVVISLFNIEKQYYDFLNSAYSAKDANGNPFAQPTSIKSSVTGGIGIFTNLALDRKQIKLE